MCIRDSTTLTLTVTGVNDAPIAFDDVAITTQEDTGVENINVLGNDTDIDDDPLTVSDASATNGVVTINEDGTLNYTPNANFNGADTITYTISDGQGGTDTATLSVTVEAIQDLAEVEAGATIETDEDAPISGTVADNVATVSYTHLTLPTILRV